MRQCIRSGDVLNPLETYAGGSVFFELSPKSGDSFMVQYTLPRACVPGSFEIPTPDQNYDEDIFQRRGQNPSRSRSLFHYAKTDLAHLSDQESTSLALSYGMTIKDINSAIDDYLDYKSFM